MTSACCKPDVSEVNTAKVARYVYHDGLDLQFYTFASIEGSVVAVHASGNGRRMAFTFSVYFSILFQCVITSMHCFYKDHKYLCACLPVFLKLTLFNAKAGKYCCFVCLVQAVIVIRVFRYSVKSCPILTTLLLKCIFLRWFVSWVFASLIMFGIRTHTSVRAYTQAHTHPLTHQKYSLSNA